MAVSIPGAVRVGAAWVLAVPFIALSTPTAGLLGVGGTIALAGLALRAWAAGTIHKDEALTTSGPYALTRNPLYLGSFLIGFGLAVAGGHWIWPALFVGFFSVVYGPTIAREAEGLSRRFGEEYAQYASRVPAFLPRLAAHGDRSLRGFAWSRYLSHREWEALVGVVAAFGILVLKM